MAYCKVVAQISGRSLTNEDFQELWSHRELENTDASNGKIKELAKSF